MTVDELIEALQAWSEEGYGEFDICTKDGLEYRWISKLDRDTFQAAVILL